MLNILISRVCIIGHTYHNTETVAPARVPGPRRPDHRQRGRHPRPLIPFGPRRARGTDHMDTICGVPASWGPVNVWFGALSPAEAGFNAQPAEQKTT